VPQYISTDEGKLRQILINLLGNAIKFTESGKVTLYVTLEPTSLTSQPVAQANPAATNWALEDSPEESTSTKPSLTLRFEVADTGPGIAAQELPNLFKPFVQTKAGQQSQEGTGLGLAISRQFIQLMGGDIIVRTTPGQGTTFIFSIQAQPAAPLNSSPIPPPARSSGLPLINPPTAFLWLKTVGKTATCWSASSTPRLCSPGSSKWPGSPRYLANLATPFNLDGYADARDGWV
jgi:light-regulated signal transduction histidine kinase (bacteriophytochrome)